jgi:hypothetical protein
MIPSNDDVRPSWALRAALLAYFLLYGGVIGGLVAIVVKRLTGA